MKSVRDIARLYLRNCKARVEAGDLSEVVREGYERDLNSFLEMFGDKPTDRLRQHDLTEWLSAHPSWKAVTTKRRCIAAVLACFRWAKEEELIPACPYASPRALRGLIAETRRPATHEEFRTLVRFGSRPLKLALIFLYHTGCRTCEMRELTWDAVRIDGPDAPHLYLVKHKTVRRTGMPRIVGLSPLAVRLLRALRRITKGPHVFTNCDGNPWKKTTFTHHFRRTAERCGLDDGIVDRVSAYCLRHTYACDGIESGFTADQVAHQLGHSSPAMVSRVYAKHVGQRVGFISGVAVGISARRK